MPGATGEVIELGGRRLPALVVWHAPPPEWEDQAGFELFAFLPAGESKELVISARKGSRGWRVGLWSSSIVNGYAVHGFTRQSPIRTSGDRADHLRLTAEYATEAFVDEETAYKLITEWVTAETQTCTPWPSASAAARRRDREPCPFHFGLDVA